MPSLNCKASICIYTVQSSKHFMKIQLSSLQVGISTSDTVILSLVTLKAVPSRTICMYINAGII
jgi:hypothetical protein